MNKIGLALAQTCIVWEDKAANYKKAEYMLRQAKAHHADTIFFPEMSFTGFSMNISATAEEDEATLTHMRRLSAAYQMHIGFGWVKACGERAQNHYTVLNQTGEVLSDYIKIHPFSYSGEDKQFQGGSEISFFKINHILCSSFICYDLRFPEIFQAASKQAEVIVVAANWPASRSEHWKTLLRARAIENQVYIVAVNCVGTIGGTEYLGDSCVFNPYGENQAGGGAVEGLIYYEIPGDTAVFRRDFPIRQDRREELYRRLMDQSNEVY